MKAKSLWIVWFLLAMAFTHRDHKLALPLLLLNFHLIKLKGESNEKV